MSYTPCQLVHKHMAERNGLFGSIEERQKNMQGNKVITIKAIGKRNDWMESSVGKQRQVMICNKPLHVLPRGKTEKKKQRRMARSQ